MAGTTHSVLAQQVRNTRGRQHKLFPQMEQRPQSSNLWVWRNSAILTSNLQTTPKDGTTFLPSNLAWKRHQQEKHSWALAARLLEQEQSDVCPSLTSTTNRCLTSSLDKPWHQQQHLKHNYNQRWFSIHQGDNQQQWRRRLPQTEQLRHQNRKVDHNFHQKQSQTCQSQQQHQHGPAHQWPQHQQVAAADQQCRHHQRDRWQTI